MTDTTPLLSLSVFCLTSFCFVLFCFFVLWMSIKWRILSLRPRMDDELNNNNGPTIMAVANRQIEEDVGAWHEQTQTRKRAFLSLLWWFLSDISYSSRYTETANTSFSFIFKSCPIYYLLKLQHNKKVYCLLKRAPTSTFLKSTQSSCTKKVEHLEKRRLVPRFFSVRPPAAADTLSSMRTTPKNGGAKEKKEKKTYVDTGSYKQYVNFSHLREWIRLNSGSSCRWKIPEAKPVTRMCVGLW